MLCPHCGKETPENQKYCQNCGKPLTTEKSSNKKFILIVCFLAFLLIIIISAILYISLKDSVKYIDKSISSTTKPTASKTIDYKSETLKEMTYKVPSSWAYSDYDDGNYHYDSKNNLLTVYATDFDEEINEENSESFIKGLVYADDMSNVTEISKDFTYICSEKALHYIYTCEISNNDMYMNVYAFNKNGYLYGFLFGSHGNKQSDEFNATETDIIDSIRFDGSSAYIEPTSVEPTTEEPTTEEPTEPPTEKPTDITEPMTLLYEDSEISVYFSDIEPSYYDDEVDVHLFIDNKTDNQLELHADVVILDGISYNDVICADLISAKTRGIVEISVDRCSNISPSTFGADLHYYPTDNFDDRVYLNIVSKTVK